MKDDRLRSNDHIQERLQKPVTFRFKPEQAKLVSLTVPIVAIEMPDETDQACDLLLA